MQKVAFPKVYKNSEMNDVTIVYWNRAESYSPRGFDVTREWEGEHALPGSKFDPFAFEEMLKGMKFRRVIEAE